MSVASISRSAEEGGGKRQKKVRLEHAEGQAKLLSEHASSCVAVLGALASLHLFSPVTRSLSQVSLECLPLVDGIAVDTLR